MTHYTSLRYLLPFFAVLLLAACSGSPSTHGYYKDDGPGSSAPNAPDAVPRAEPISARNNKPYQAQGKTWVPRTTVVPFRQRGIASWYGRRFHGKPTASGELYNMYAMTAAHPTLPIPSYARVTAINTGRSVTVRINDRGPFLHGRIIDLSWAAANKLGYANKGSTEVEVEQIMPGTDTQTERNVTASVENSNARTTFNRQNLFLQLGAFTSFDNAEHFRTRALALTDLSEKIALEASEGAFRVIVGPYYSAESARVAARQIGKQLNIEPFIIRRNLP